MNLEEIMSSKYTPLTKFLMKKPQTIKSIDCSFAELESVLGFILPSSAYKHAPWWANQTECTNRPQCKAWMQAGFEVTILNQTPNKGSVRFTRVGNSPSFSSKDYNDKDIETPAPNRSEKKVLANTDRSIPANSIILISCVKLKSLEACNAEHMYVSPLYKKMMTVAKQTQPKQIFILSAKYGLLNLEDVIEPYELELKRLKASERRIWAAEVIDSLNSQTNLKEDFFVFLAGKTYRQYITPSLANYSVPMRGVALGNQLKWLGDRIL